MIGDLLALIYDESRRIWRYRWLAVVTGLLILAAGAAAVLRLPPVYDAWGQIFVNKQTPVTTAAQSVSLVGENYGSPYVVAKTLLNDEQLEHVVRQINPAARAMSKAELAGAVAGLKSRIQLTPDQGDGFFEIHVRDNDPNRAYRVAQLLMNEFVARNLGRNQDQLRQAGDFLDSQIASYEAMLAESRARIADFQAQHPRLTAAAPTAAPVDPALETELTEARAAYQAAVAQAPAQAARPAAANEKVAALQARLDALRSQYTEQYPDVVAVKRQLGEAITERDAAAREAAAAATAPDPGLEAARRRLALAQRRAAAPRAAAPPVPAALQSEWAELQKSDEVLRINYQQLIARREAARLSQAAYGADGSSKYQVTRRPTVPQLPVGPKRALYLGLVVLGAIGGGLGAAYVRGAVQGIFVSPRELEQVFQLPVVGTVSWEPAWSTATAARPGAFGAALLGAGRRRKPKAKAARTTVRLS